MRPLMFGKVGFEEADALASDVHKAIRRRRNDAPSLRSLMRRSRPTVFMKGAPESSRQQEVAARVTRRSVS